MKVKTRFNVVLLALAIVLVGSLATFRYYESRSLVRLFSGQAEERHKLFDAVMALETRPLETLAYDYTYWDDMVEFADHGGAGWGEENLGSSVLAAYSASGVWVFGRDGRLVLARTDPAIPGLESVDLPPGLLEKLDRERLMHFFMDTRLGLLEVHCATIHPSSDAPHETTPRGYFMAARVWDRDLVEDLGRLSGSKVTLEPAAGKPDLPADPAKGEIRFHKGLPGWDGRPVTRLHVSTTSRSVVLFNTWSRDFTTVLVLAALLVILTIAASVMGWVSMPLDRIARALGREDASHLGGMPRSRTEFGDVARLIVEFFRQKRDLESEVEERRRTQEALRASRAGFHSIVEKGSDGIAVLDPTGRVQFANRSALRLLGWDPAEIPGKAWDVPPEEGGARSVDVLRADGTQGAGEISLAETEWEGGVAQLAVIRDVTERREAEKSQRLAQLGRLTADMAHEVNNPLQIISGYAELGLARGTGLDATTRERLGIIFEQAMRAAEIVQRLLSYARRGRGDQRIADVHQSLSAVIGLVEHQFRLAGARMVRRFADGPLMVRADEKQLQEVYLNLLNNARDAMPDGGVIEISTSVADDRVRVSFRDSGGGIDDETMKHVLEPFFTTRERGTGLGLYVCLGIARAHGGDLSIESEPLKGTAVSLILPRAGTP